LWLRPLDVPAFLAARRYATADRLVLEVRDEVRPDGAAAGRFLLEGGPDGASCVPTTSAPDLVLDPAALGAISLGGTPATALARAGLVEERAAGALGRADQLFAADRAPFCFTWF
jgi:predicted acetyltransferase